MPRWWYCETSACRTQGRQHRPRFLGVWLSAQCRPFSTPSIYIWYFDTLHGHLSFVYPHLLYHLLEWHRKAVASTRIVTKDQGWACGSEVQMSRRFESSISCHTIINILFYNAARAT